MGEEQVIELPGFEEIRYRERFRDKTEQYFKAHENDPVVVKLRFNEPLNAEDVDTLEMMLVEAGTGTADEMAEVRSGDGLGLFVRSRVGLDREAAKPAFDGFLNGKVLSANQITNYEAGKQSIEGHF